MEMCVHLSICPSIQVPCWMVYRQLVPSYGSGNTIYCGQSKLFYTHLARVFTSLYNTAIARLRTLEYIYLFWVSYTPQFLVWLGFITCFPGSVVLLADNLTSFLRIRIWVSSINPKNKQLRRRPCWTNIREVSKISLLYSWLNMTNPNTIDSF